MFDARELTSDQALRIRQRLHQSLIESVESEPFAVDDESLLKKRLWDLLDEFKSGLGHSLNSDQCWRLCHDVANDVLGLGPLRELMNDPDITDILVNGADTVWVDRAGRLELTNVRFDDEAHVRRVVDRYVGAEGKHLDSMTPAVDARLPDGSRMHIVIPPLSRNGTTISIRRFRPSHASLADLVESGMLSRDMADLLIVAVKARINIVFAGGAGAGKTTLLNAVSEFIPDNERIVTVEESAELALRHRHVITLEGRPGNSEGRGRIDLRVLVRNALRMRADRIIVGEVRGDEVFDMLQAMNVGHDGSLTTIHANSPRQTLKRMETLAMFAEGQAPRETVRSLIESAVQLIVQISRSADGQRRVTSISELQWAGDGSDMVDLFYTNRDSGFVAGPVRPAFFDDAHGHRLNAPTSLTRLWPESEEQAC